MNQENSVASFCYNALSSVQFFSCPCPTWFLYMPVPLLTAEYCGIVKGDCSSLFTSRNNLLDLICPFITIITEWSSKLDGSSQVLPGEKKEFLNILGSQETNAVLQMDNGPW